MTTNNLWSMTAEPKGKTPADEGIRAARQEAREAFFKMIEPKGNWKGRIDAWINPRDFDACSKAAVWFTGAPLKIVETKHGRVRVTAPGYYAAVGS